MKYQTTIFPSQKLSSKLKNDSWKEACVDYVIGMSDVAPGGGDKTYFDEMQSNYDLYLSKFDKKDLKYVTDPFNQEDGFPASPQNFNIIKPKIDLLIGEESKRPFNFKIARTSQSAVSDMQEKMKSMVMDYMMAKVMAGMSPEEAEQYQAMLQSGEIMPPEEIAKFMSKDYKDVAESSAYHALSYLKEKLNIPHQFNKGFSDLLKGAKEVFYVGINNSDPFMERVDPRYFNHDHSPDIEFIEDGDWACRKMRMSYTEVYDRLYDKMTEDQLDRLMEISGQEPNAGRYGKDAPALDYTHVKMKSVSSSHDETFLDSNIVDMWHVTWRSYKKIGFLAYQDENGQIQETVVSEDYMKTGMEVSLEWRWVIEVWEGYRIGEDLYVGIQPIEYQHISADNPNSQKLPYFGVIYNDNKSLVSIMKPLQYMYIIIWYRLELALARDKGKVITMDITQIPKSMNIDPAKWMHYLSAIGVNFVNPYEDGWDIPGREGGRASQFNQIAALDLTMANVIGQYIDMMSKIEDMISEISGVSRQRQGSISSNELVGNVERSVVQSAHITESIFWLHNQCKRNVLRGLLNTAKEAWRDSNKTNLQYILNDSTRTFLTLADNFFYEDFDIFVSDSTKDMHNLDMVKSLYQPAMQNGATLLDIANIMTLENMTEIKSALKDIEDRRMQMQKEMEEAEAQRQQQLVAMQNEVKQQEIALRQQEMELEKYKIDSDNQTKIAVAQLGAYKFQDNLDADNNGIPDPIEIGNLALKRNQLDADIADREMQNSIKQSESIMKQNNERAKIANQREAENRKAGIEKKKILLEEKKLAAAKALQAAKDKAAMEREKVKARTALKNKTSGEK